MEQQFPLPPSPYAKVAAAIGAASIAVGQMAFARLYGLTTEDLQMQVFLPNANTVAACIAALVSAVLWFRTAFRTDDKLSNAAAAGFSGVAALFSAGAMGHPFSDTLIMPNLGVSAFSDFCFLTGWATTLAIVLVTRKATRTL